MIFDVYSRDASREAANGATRERAQRAPEPQNQLLDLQQQYGNAAVTRLVQRTPKDRPASTDAPGHHDKAPAKKAPAADIHARVIKSDIDQDMVRITIGSGPDQGVQVGMAGSLVKANGMEVADFTIETASGRVSTAHVKVILDQVNADPNVIIKASSFESQEGKEF